MISTWKVREIDYSEGNSQRSKGLIWPFNNGKEQKKRALDPQRRLCGGASKAKAGEQTEPSDSPETQRWFL